MDILLHLMSKGYKPCYIAQYCTFSRVWYGLWVVNGCDFKDIDALRRCVRWFP